MSELTPITRVESYLDAIVNNGIPPTEDITRIETFLQAIYDNQVCQLTPITRIEMFLGKISGQSLTLPEPITRVEMYLAAIADEDVELPEEPITRIEMYLAEWADSGDWTTISGAIVEFITQRAHKLKSCVVSLSPKQDLHGYDSPWPAGGGKQIFYHEGNMSATSHGVTAVFDGETQTITITGTNDSESAYVLLNIPFTVDVPRNVALCRAFIGAPVGIYINFTYRKNRTWTEVNNGGTVPEEIDEGTTINIQLGVYSSATSFNGEQVKIQVERGSAAPTAWTPYSNICPISGWTECEVFDTGHNVWDEEWEIGDIDRTTGQNAYSSTQIRSVGYIKVAASTAYYVCCSSSVAGANICLLYYDSNKNFLSSQWGVNFVRTTPSNCQYIRLVSNGTYGNTYHNDISINYPGTDHDYHAYQGNSYPVTWEDEVFGGTVDVVSGNEETKKVRFNAKDVTWNDAGSGRVYTSLSLSPTELTTVLCSHCTYVRRPAVGEYENWIDWGGYPNSNRNLIVTMKGITDTLSQWNAYIQSNDVEFVYTLETQTPTAITPTPITALKGYNAMWSDGGDIEVTVHGTPVEVSTQQALNMLLGGAYRNDQTADDVSDEEALDIILGGDNK